MPDVQTIPPLSTIGDQNIVRVLRPLVDGWNLRNGSSGKGFVTRDELTAAIPAQTTTAVDTSDIEGRLAKLEQLAATTTAQAQKLGTQYSGAPSSVTAYSSPNRTLTVTATAGSSIFLVARITYASAYDRWSYAAVVTGVYQAEDKTIQPSSMQIPYSSDLMNGGGVVVKLMANGEEVTNVQATPEAAKRHTAVLNAVYTCTADGTYMFSLDDSEQFTFGRYWELGSTLTALVVK